MRLCILGFLTLGAAVVEGYKDTSPFFFASTSECVATWLFICAPAESSLLMPF
jgi:hypothetical protein